MNFQNKEFENIYHELITEWFCLHAEFEYEKFKATAIRTFPWLYKYCKKDSIPKQIAVLLMCMRMIESPAPFSIGCEGKEYDAVCQVIRELTMGLWSDNWCAEYIEDPYGNRFETGHYILIDNVYIIDTRTFDLSEMINDQTDYSN